MHRFLLSLYMDSFKVFVVIQIVGEILYVISVFSYEVEILPPPSFPPVCFKTNKSFKSKTENRQWITLPAYDLCHFTHFLCHQENVYFCRWLCSSNLH